MEKLRVIYPVIVEGKYDKIKLESVIDADIFVTDGFRVFAREEARVLFSKLAKKTKVIVLTDSDGGGRVIRNFFNSVLDKDRIIHLYIPSIEGKEKRKNKPSKDGTLGVEGMDVNLLKNLFSPFTGEIKERKGGQITKTDMYEWGLCGRDNSAQKRADFSKYLGFPADMTANALLCAVNVLYSKEEVQNILAEFTEIHK